MKAKLEGQIEQLKLKMYEAYNDKSNYDNVLEISQELDKLLNKLRKLNND